jgi:isoleucyl-tRNA synthetase
MSEPNPSETNLKASELNYKDTLRLPKTGFPMRAGASTREPEIQAFWESEKIYQSNLASKNKSHAFILHDGPPYLSSDKIHIGTALNKILKDIVVRYKTQKGFYAPYVPGYDGHGLPIEAAVEKKIKGGRKSITALELREKCRAFALSNLKGQETNFKRLGVMGHWDAPYLTIDPSFEATQIELFAQMLEKGYVYKGLKPVHWCPISESAMAEAEIEYEDHESHSIYVAFTLPTLEKRYGDPLTAELATVLEGASLVIWTTTPWTMPANVAIAVHETVDYVVVQAPQHGKVVLALDLLETLAPKFGVDPAQGFKPLMTFKGRELKGLVAKHPFIERKSVVLAADFVTTDSGTGLVHIAGGHGPDDFFVVKSYNRQELKDHPLPIISPVDEQGKFRAEAGVPHEVVGVFYEKANWILLEIMKKAEALLWHGTFTHSFPHSWRSHAPVIFRATEQWFIQVDAFRDTALAEIKNVQWIPARGESRLSTMVANRPEWCVSRQRVWGVPIPAFYCEKCKTVHLTTETTAWVAEVFRQESSDAWAKYDADHFLQGRLICTHCGHDRFTKEEDVMDVWFDSGVSHTAVVEARHAELGHVPVDLYLEGSDQHRGWFQSSLLTSVMLRDKAPYKAVLTHGFVLDENGRKMSKSLGNVIDPNTVMREYGADVLRLWVASVDYTSDVKIGGGTLKQLGDIYRKIRNTCRFLMGNLHGFNPEQDRVPYEQLSVLDTYVLHRLSVVTHALEDAFERYEFHRFYQLLQNLCVVELSSLYFDVVKDVLYCHGEKDARRLGVQSVLYHILSTLTRVIIPVMPHMAEDIWSHWPKEQKPDFALAEGAPTSILLAPWPELPTAWVLSAEKEKAFEALLMLRETVNAGLEQARSQEEIGSSLEASILIQPLSPTWQFVQALDENLLETIFLVSGVEVLTSTTNFYTEYAVLAEEEVDGEYKVYVIRATGDKCQRCWQYKETVGAYVDHPSLCTRCHHAVLD